MCETKRVKKNKKIKEEDKKSKENKRVKKKKLLNAISLCCFRWSKRW